MSVPWEFSKPAAPGAGVPNLPTPDGIALGKEVARLTQIELKKMHGTFPDAPHPCVECAFIEGTVPNGCAETVADALKCAVEGVPFYCHKGMKDGQPQRLCAGWYAASGAFEKLERVKAIEDALYGINGISKK